MPRLRVALAQLSPTVGALEANLHAMLDAYARADAAGCDLVAFTELAVTGYPPEDLVLKPGFVADNRAVLAKLAWKHVPSPEFEPASIPGAATTVQFMVKDSRKYAATGGWGFGRFINGKPADEAQHRTCFACHQARVKDHDRVFTRWAP